MKQFKLYGSIAVLGIAILAASITIIYLYAAGGTQLSVLPPYLTLFFIPYLTLFFIVCGTVFLIAGILGIGRQYFKNHKNLFTVLTLILVPLLVFTVIVLMIASIPRLV